MIRRFFFDSHLFCPSIPLSDSQRGHVPGGWGWVACLQGHHPPPTHPPPTHPPPTSRHAGVALLTALLIVTVATSTTLAVASRQHLERRQTANLLGRDQAYLVALGGELWAKQLLTEDLKEGKIDTLHEIWATRPPAISVEGGHVQGRIQDAQSFFNINTLVDHQGKKNPVAMTRFQRLLEHFDMNPDLAVAVADWIDSNQTVGGPGGAEDEQYIIRSPPYLTANQPFSSISELALVAGLDPAQRERLTPWLTALPEATPINVNTAPPEILRILAPDLSMAEAQQLANSRQVRAFSHVEAFLNHSVMKEKSPFSAGLSVSSRYFQASLDAQIGRGRIRLVSLLVRREQTVQVLSRRQGVE